jgi:hypothetical protein
LIPALEGIGENFFLCLVIKGNHILSCVKYTVKIPKDAGLLPSWLSLGIWVGCDEPLRCQGSSELSRAEPTLYCQVEYCLISKLHCELQENIELYSFLVVANLYYNVAALNSEFVKISNDP